MVQGARSRVALEAAFLIAVAAAAGFLSLSIAMAAGVMAGAWVLVAATEWRTSRRRPAHSASSDDVPEPVADPEPLAEPVPPVEPEAPSPDPEGVPPPLTEPLPPAAEPAVVVQPEPEQDSTPAPGVLRAAPEPGPREWNIWELERAVRASAGRGVEPDEERAYLLMYLRDFAGPDGFLPPNFDGLVRESFGDLLGSGTR